MYIYIYLFINIVTRYYILYVTNCCFNSDSAFLQYFFKESLYSLGANYLPSRNWRGFILEEVHFNVIVLVLSTS